MAKTILTLNFHIEKYEEKAVMTLRSEPVTCSGEIDEKNLPEFEQARLVS